MNYNNIQKHENKVIREIFEQAGDWRRVLVVGIDYAEKSHKVILNEAAYAAVFPIFPLNPLCHYFLLFRESKKRSPLLLLYGGSSRAAKFNNGKETQK